MSPRPKLGHIRRPQIIEAAQATIYERGFSETRIIDIADHAGTSAATILYYFESKETLLEEALTHSDESFYSRLREELDALDTASAQLVHIIERCSLPPDPFDDWTLWMEMWLQVRHRPHLRGTYERLEHVGQQPMIAEVIQRGQQSGEFSATVDADDVATMLSALIDGLGIQVTLQHPDVSGERMASLCLAAATSELGFVSQRRTTTDGPPAPVVPIGARAGKR
ncbi:MAG: TetR family transcriptional regulator C-terminal domain-containing protein [Solirubrobacteraceae bacterium]